MSVLSRLGYPENFYDMTDDQLLLQPEPQYLFARMMYGALAASLDVGGEFGLMAGRTVSENGAPYVTPESQRLDLNGGQTIAAQVFAAKIDFNGKPGSTIRLNRPLYPNTTYTMASRKIVQGSTITTVPIVVGSEQTDLTLFRFGGPYDQTNLRVAPFAIDAFDAQMGVHKEAQVVGGNFKRDYDKFNDSVWVTLSDKSSVNVYPASFTTPADNDATTSNAGPMDYDTIARAEESLDTANIPYFATGKRIIVLTPRQLREVKNDAQYARYAEFHPEYNALFPEYVQDIGKFHVLKSNTLNTPLNGSNIAIHHGLAFGPGAFAVGMGRKPRIAYSTDDNYGETAKGIWLADMAYQLADSRFIVGVRST